MGLRVCKLIGPLRCYRSDIHHYGWGGGGGGGGGGRDPAGAGISPLDFRCR